MIPDKTQELDLRELMARYERDYGSEAEREFFGRDWSKFVAEDDGAELDAEDEGRQASTPAQTGAEWAPKPRLRDWLLRAVAVVDARAGRHLTWLSLSLLGGAVLSGLGWWTLNDGRETSAASTLAPSSPERSSLPGLARGATSPAHAAETTPTSLSTATAPSGERGERRVPALAERRELDSDQTTSLGGVSSQSARETDAEPMLARRAVDAVLAGDRGRALDLYRELSRRTPQSEVYREATRILARSAAPSSTSPDARPSSPSDQAREVR